MPPSGIDEGPRDAHSASMRARRPRSRPSPFSKRRDRRAVQFVKPMAQVVDDSLEAGREAAQRRAWRDAYDLLKDADEARAARSGRRRESRRSGVVDRPPRRGDRAPRARVRGLRRGGGAQACRDDDGVARHGLRPARLALRLGRAGSRAASACSPTSPRASSTGTSRSFAAPTCSTSASSSLRAKRFTGRASWERATATAASRRRRSSSRVRFASGRGT